MLLLKEGGPLAIPWSSKEFECMLAVYSKTTKTQTRIHLSNRACQIALLLYLTTFNAKKQTVPSFRLILRQGANKHETRYTGEKSFFRHILHGLEKRARPRACQFHQFQQLVGSQALASSQLR